VSNHLLYYVDTDSGDWLTIHNPHPNKVGESHCGSAGLVSTSPMYIVTCSRCVQLARRES
jgi:hypothetical protein